jgi:hypothetical protein
MNISTKAIRCLFVLIGLSCAVVFNASAQNVNSLSLSSAGDTARWDTVLVGEKPTGNNVTVMAGDTKRGHTQFVKQRCQRRCLYFTDWYRHSANTRYTGQ